jgi:hypothetical protein
MLSSSLNRTRPLGHIPVGQQSLRALAYAAGSALTQRLDVLQTPGAPNEQTSAWIRSADPQRSSLSTATGADIAEPLLYYTSFEPQARSEQAHVSQIY